MNYKLMGRFISEIIAVEALFMLPALMICLIDSDNAASWAFIITEIIMLVICIPLFLFCKNSKHGFYAKEGIVCVGVSWIVLSLLGALPFCISGAIPNYLDSLFEIVSGFTTTGASILPEVESLPRGILYWRSFSHWLGGMGVLVFLLAVMPTSSKNEGFTMHILRAESPGPDVGKLVPKMKKTAKILYLLYIALTAANILFLIAGKMPIFDALCTAFGTAGTGGFGIKNDSIAGYSTYIQTVCTVFMILFGVNFSCYYLILLRRFKTAFRDEELRLYLGIIILSSFLIVLNLNDTYSSVGERIHQATFHVASIMTTTGFAIGDFNEWPTFSKALLMCLMTIGACAGSTGGGIKCGRILLIFKSLIRNIKQIMHPQNVLSIRNNGQVVKEQVIANTNAYLAVYVIIFVFSFLVIAGDGFSVTTSSSAVLACFNNIGPGLDLVGPVSNYSCFGVLSKIMLIIDMLAGRLEIFPILILFSPATWRKR